jgi:hypothetical protein
VEGGECAAGESEAQPEDDQPLQLVGGGPGRPADPEREAPVGGGVADGGDDEREQVGRVGPDRLTQQ